MTHLVTITPGEILRANVLVWVFDTFLQRRHVAPVLPVLDPEIVCVDSTKDQTWNDSAVWL